MTLKRYLLPLVFVGGLLLGWLVVGWLLWPVHWTNTLPSELHPEYQRVYVGLVAEEYWRTRNLGRVREALEDWDDRALAELLVRMDSEASSLEERERLAALVEVLALPVATLSVWDMLLDHKVIFLSTGLSASLLVVAVTLGFSTLVRDRARPPAAEPAGVLEQSEAEQVAGEIKQLFEDIELPEEELFGETEPEEATEQQPKEAIEQSRTAPEGLEEAEPGEAEQSERARLKEATEKEATEQPEGISEQSQAEEDYPEEDEEVSLFDEDEEPKSTTGSLFSFFEEEESKLPELEALCKNLPEVDIDELSRIGRDVVTRFRTGVRKLAEDG